MDLRSSLDTVKLTMISTRLLGGLRSILSMVLCASLVFGLLLLFIACIYGPYLLLYKREKRSHTQYLPQLLAVQSNLAAYLSFNPHLRLLSSLATHRVTRRSAGVLHTGGLWGLPKHDITIRTRIRLAILQNIVPDKPSRCFNKNTETVKQIIMEWIDGKSYVVQLDAQDVADMTLADVSNLLPFNYMVLKHWVYLRHNGHLQSSATSVCEVFGDQTVVVIHAHVRLLGGVKGKTDKPRKTRFDETARAYNSKAIKAWINPNRIPLSYRNALGPYIQNPHQLSQLEAGALWAALSRAWESEQPLEFLAFLAQSKDPKKWEKKTSMITVELERLLGPLQTSDTVPTVNVLARQRRSIEEAMRWFQWLSSRRPSLVLPQLIRQFTPENLAGGVSLTSSAPTNAVAGPSSVAGGSPAKDDFIRQLDLGEITLAQEDPEVEFLELGLDMEVELDSFDTEPEQYLDMLVAAAYEASVKDADKRGKRVKVKTRGTAGGFKFTIPSSIGPETRQKCLQVLVDRMIEGIYANGRGLRHSREVIAEHVHGFAARILVNKSDAQLHLIEAIPSLHVTPEVMKFAGLIDKPADESIKCAIYWKVVPGKRTDIDNFLQSAHPDTVQYGERVQAFLDHFSSPTRLTDMPEHLIAKPENTMFWSHIGRFSNGWKSRHISEVAEAKKYKPEIGARPWIEAIRASAGARRIVCYPLSDNSELFGAKWVEAMSWDEVLWTFLLLNPLTTNVAWPGESPPVPPVQPRGEVGQLATMTRQMRLHYGALCRNNQLLQGLYASGVQIDGATYTCLLSLGFRNFSKRGSSEADPLKFVRNYRPSSDSFVGIRNRKAVITGLDRDFYLPYKVTIDNGKPRIFTQCRLFVLGATKSEQEFTLRPAGTSHVEHNLFNPSSIDMYFATTVTPTTPTLLSLYDSGAGVMKVRVRHLPSSTIARPLLGLVLGDAPSEWLADDRRGPRAFVFQPEALELLLGREVPVQGVNDLAAYECATRREPFFRQVGKGKAATTGVSTGEDQGMAMDQTFPSTDIQARWEHLCARTIAADTALKSTLSPSDLALPFRLSMLDPSRTGVTEALQRRIESIQAQRAFLIEHQDNFDLTQLQGTQDFLDGSKVWNT